MSYTRDDMLRILEGAGEIEKEDRAEFKEDFKRYEMVNVNVKKFIFTPPTHINIFDLLADDPNLYLIDVAEYLEDHNMIDLENFLNFHLQIKKIEIQDEKINIDCPCGGTVKIKKFKKLEQFKVCNPYHLKTKQHTQYMKDSNICNNVFVTYLKRLLESNPLIFKF